MDLIVKTFAELNTTELYEILKSRSEIFIMERNMHCMDIDNLDYRSLHCFFMQENRVSAYLRAYCEDNDRNTVRLGRVLTLEHGKGLGKELLEKSIMAIKSRLNCKKIIMDAQKHAAGFYQKLGFVITSGDFLEEGVIHVVMELSL